MKRNPPAFGFVVASFLESPFLAGLKVQQATFATVSGLSTGISEGDSPAAEDPKAEDIAPGKGEPGTLPGPPPPPPPVFLLGLDRAVDQHKFEGLRKITVSVATKVGHPTTSVRRVPFPSYRKLPNPLSHNQNPHPKKQKGSNCSE